MRPGPEDRRTWAQMWVDWLGAVWPGVSPQFLPCETHRLCQVLGGFSGQAVRGASCAWGSALRLARAGSARLLRNRQNEAPGQPLAGWRRTCSSSNSDQSIPPGSCLTAVMQRPRPVNSGLSVHQDAWVEALQTGDIKAVALDVARPQPLPRERAGQDGRLPRGSGAPHSHCFPPLQPLNHRLGGRGRLDCAGAWAGLHCLVRFSRRPDVCVWGPPGSRAAAPAAGRPGSCTAKAPSPSRVALVCLPEPQSRCPRSVYVSLSQVLRSPPKRWRFPGPASSARVREVL